MTASVKRKLGDCTVESNQTPLTEWGLLPRMAKRLINLLLVSYSFSQTHNQEIMGREVLYLGFLYD